MNYPLIISFYFDRNGFKYKMGAHNLAQKCNELGLDHVIIDGRKYVIPHIKSLKQRCPNVTSNRNKIVRWIPTFIKWQIEERQTPILYLHCDTVIQKLPHVSCFDGMSVGYSVGKGKYYSKPGRRNYKILSSPLYFQPSVIANEFLSEWKRRCDNNNCEKGEHCWLQNLCEEFAGREGVISFPENFSSKDHKSNANFLF